MTRLNIKYFFFSKVLFITIVSKSLNTSAQSYLVIKEQIKHYELTAAHTSCVPVKLWRHKAGFGGAVCEQTVRVQRDGLFTLSLPAVQTRAVLIQNRRHPQNLIQLTPGGAQFLRDERRLVEPAAFRRLHGNQQVQLPGGLDGLDAEHVQGVGTRRSHDAGKNASDRGEVARDEVVRGDAVEADRHGIVEHLSRGLLHVHAHGHAHREAAICHGGVESVAACVQTAQSDDSTVSGAHLTDRKCSY